MIETFLSSCSQVIEINIIDNFFQIKIYAIDLDEKVSTSCQLRVLPTPLPEALLKNMKILIDYSFIESCNKTIDFINTNYFTQAINNRVRIEWNNCYLIKFYLKYAINASKVVYLHYNVDKKYNLIQMQKDPRLNARLQIKEHNTSNNIHPMLSGEKSDSKFNFRVNVTTLTQHITSVNYFKSIIDPQAHYQIIPSIPQTLCWNIDGLISAAVEVSRYFFIYIEGKSQMLLFLIEKYKMERCQSTISADTYFLIVS